MESGKEYHIVPESSITKTGKQTEPSDEPQPPQSPASYSRGYPLPKPVALMKNHGHHPQIPEIPLLREKTFATRK